MDLPSDRTLGNRKTIRALIKKFLAESCIQIECFISETVHRRRQCHGAELAAIPLGLQRASPVSDGQFGRWQRSAGLDLGQ